MLGSTLTMRRHFNDLILTSISDFSLCYKNYTEDSESSPGNYFNSTLRGSTKPAPATNCPC
jgi:hypothetical protein